MHQLAVPPLERVWYLYYYFKKDSPDYLTHQLMDFKADKKPQLDTFSALAADAMAAEDIKFDYILRVLGSDELTATKGNRVRDIALAITNAVKCKYRPLWLEKKRKTRSLKGLKLPQRQAELEDVYFLKDTDDLNDCNVLIVDDISTTGTSLQVIAELILRQYPQAKVYGFILAKTSNPDFGGPDRNDQDSELHYREVLKKHVQ